MGEWGAAEGKDTVAEIIQELTIPKPDTYEEDEFGRPLKENGGYVLKPTKSPYQIKKWAGPLRKVASILLGMDEQYLYTTEFKESTLPRCWDRKDEYQPCGCDIVMEHGHKDGLCLNCETPTIVSHHPMTGRMFLQKIGTNAIRDGLHPNSWVNALMAEYRPPKMSEYSPSKWIVSDTRFPNELKAIKDRNGICIKIVRPSLVSTDNHSSETSLDHITDWDHVIINDGTIEDLIGKVKTILEQEGIL